MQKLTKFLAALAGWLLLTVGPAFAQDAGAVRLSVSRDGSVKEVLDAICSDINGSLLVRSTDVDLSRTVSIHMKDATLDEVLSRIFDGSDVKWTVSGKQIQIYRPQVREPQGQSQQGNRTVSGSVLDEKGEPVIGAAVFVEGTSIASITDLNGQWTLSVPTSTKSLKVSCIGYEDVDLPLGKDSTYPLVLKENIDILEESVVVGYGVQKKSVVTAAISSVKGDQLSGIAPTRVDNVLKGMVSGVTITPSSGQPGSGTRVRIRGVGTINDSNPLYIVDGMPVTGGIEYINPADIESVEVLKDAASAAIYGARGANGVILVTTRQGFEGKSVISYNASYGVQNPWRMPSVLNATEYALIINEMYMNMGESPVYDDPYAFGEGTNWVKEVFNSNAPVLDHQLSISGGNSKMNFFLSGSYFYQEGIIGGNYNHSNYDRVTLRANNNYTVFDSKERDYLTTLRLGTNVTYSHDKSRSINANSEYGSVLGCALSLSPILPVYAEDPEALLAEHPTAIKDSEGRPFSIVGDQFAAMPNPLAMMHQPTDDYFQDKIVAGGYAELEIIKGLKFKSSIGADLFVTKDDGYSIPFYMNSNHQNSGSQVWSSISRSYSWQVENTLSYQFTLGEAHNLTALLGQSAYSHSGAYVSGTSYKIRNVEQPWIDATDQDSNLRSASGSPDPYSRLASYFARVSYDYAERYMVELTIRRDGSSNFSPANKWANFPSASVGWNLTNEPFMAGRPAWLDRTKLRVSYGMNGNQNIGAFAYTSMMQGIAGYMLGVDSLTALAPGIIPRAYSNADLKWEESSQFDVGVDIGLWKNQLSLSLDYYDKRTNGMLMTMSLPAYIGNSLPWGNVGNMKNSGVEFDITWKQQLGDFGYNISANGSYNKNVLLKLGNDTGYQNYDAVHGNLGTISRAENGMPFPFFWGYKTDGIFQSDIEAAAYVNQNGERYQPDAKAGDVKFLDIAGAYDADGNPIPDGVIDDADRTYIGKGMPDWTFGVNLGATWKGLDLSANFYSAIGGDIYDATRRADFPLVNMQRYMLDRWTGPGTSNRLPRLTAEADGGKNQNWRSSDIMVYDGSFLHLRNLTLGYTLPEKWSRAILISKLRVYLNAENLFTLTSYHGMDPEISSGGTSVGIDKGVYPQARTLSAGINLTF